MPAYRPVESWFSAYSDCDDRAVLFARWVKKRLGMKVTLIYYPGVYLATAVHFDDPQVTGDYGAVDNCKSLVCYPTYVGAESGMTMPDLRDTPVEIIRLQDAR